MKIVNIETDSRGIHEESVFASLGADYKCVKCDGDFDTISQEAGEADIILFTATPIDKELIDRLPKAQLFVRYGVGYDRVDLEYTKARDVIVCNAPSYGSYDIAEHAFALLMAVNRKIASYDQNIRAGLFGKGAAYNSYRLYNKILGLVGFGRIARNMVDFASGFHMDVLVYDPFIEEKEIASYGARKVDFNQLLKEADYISVHSPLTSKTAKMFSTAEFSQMKDTAVIINTARGGLIDTEALIEALKNKVIRGAGIDVYDDYPKSTNHPLLTLENLVMTPHVAWNSVEAGIALQEEVTAEVARFIKGEPLLNRVNG